jgi:3-oxoacyl-[acyl-carrier-protein] synthase III
VVWAVDVELFGQLALDQPRRRTLTLEEPIAVREIIDRLGLDPDSIGLIVINGVQSEMPDLVPPDGRLCFFPPVSGG